MQVASPIRGLFNYCLVLLGAYVAVSFYAVLWISDEFDWERGLFYAFFAVPFAIGFFSQSLYKPDWFLKNPFIFWVSLAAVILSFGWGHFLWLNAISGSEDAVRNYTHEGTSFGMSIQRGGFDWLYRPRW